LTQLSLTAVSYWCCQVPAYQCCQLQLAREVVNLVSCQRTSPRQTPAVTSSPWQCNTVTPHHHLNGDTPCCVVIIWHM